LQTDYNNGWGFSASGALSELQASFYWSIIGILMCCIAFPCLYWNEGRCVTREVTLAKAREAAINIEKVDINTVPEHENNGKLVRFEGNPYVTATRQQDTQFGVQSSEAVHAKNITRKVQMYQWVTEFHTEQRDDGYDSQGNRKTKSVRIIDTPKMDWRTISAGTTVEQPELPDGLQGDKKYLNENKFALSSQDFHQGRVKIGPYYLSYGMAHVEINSTTTTLTPVINDIKEYIEKSPELTGEDLQGQAPPIISQEEPSQDENEDAQLLKPQASQSGGNNNSHDTVPRGPGLLTEETKDYFMRACAKDQVSLKGSTVEIKTNPSAGDTKGDYKISWEVSCLPSDSTGGVKLHTVLAAQKAGLKGHKVESWIPEGVEEFHLDSCCKFICCCGYAFVADETHGGCGCIAKMDRVIFPTTSSDASQDGEGNTDLESAGAGAASNSRKVEKLCEGSVSIEELINGMDNTNSEKTNFYRKAGFVLMFLGFQFVMDPLPTLFHFIPFIGHMIGFMVTIAVIIVACALGCFGSITTISIAWLRYRPLWGILGILVAGGIAAAICFLPGINN